MKKDTAYKATKVKSDYPSVAAKTGTEKWGQIAPGSGVNQSTVVKSLDSKK